MTDLEKKAEEVKQDLPDAEAHAEEHEDQKPIYNKHQVSDVVKREKQRAYEKGRREALMELQQQQEAEMQPQEQQQAVVNPQSQGMSNSLGGMAQLSPDQIRQMIAEEAPKVLQQKVLEAKNQQVVQSFINKMQAAEQKHPGLEAKLNELDYSTIAPLIQMANDMENTGDIMKELVDNPMKMGNLVSLLYTQPKLAAKAMFDLSNSIKQNQDALAQEKAAHDPFGSIKPSFQAGMDNESMSVADYMKMFRG